MTAKNISFCTDEELLGELKKLGYKDVSPDVLEIMKDDLSKLITKDQCLPKKSVPGNGKESTADSNSVKNRCSQKQYQRATKNLPQSVKPLSTNVDREKKYSNILPSKSESSKATTFEKYKNTLKSYKASNYRKQESVSVDNKEQKLSAEILPTPITETACSKELHGTANEQCQPNVDREKKYSNILPSKGEMSKTMTFERYKNTLKSYKAGNYRKPESLSVDNNEQKLSAEILPNPISETACSKELHGTANEQCQPNVDTEKKYSNILPSNGEIFKTTLGKYKNTLKSYKAGNHQKQESLSVDKNEQKLSAEILPNPSSEATFSKELYGTANKECQSNGLETESEKEYSNGLTSNNEISRSTSFEKYRNTLKSYKIGNYRKPESLSVDNINEKLSAEILPDPSSETEYGEKLHLITNEQYQSKRFGLKNEKGYSDVLIPSTEISKYEMYRNSLKSYKTGSYRMQESLSIDNIKEKLSSEIVPDPISETEYTEGLQGIANEQYQSKRLGTTSEKGFSDVLTSNNEISKLEKYRSTLKSYKTGNYRRPESLSIESIKEKLSAEIFPDQSSETDYYKKLHQVTNEPYQPKRFGNISEKEYSVLASNGESAKNPSFEKYKNTLKSYKIGNYRKLESLSVDSIEAKVSTGILDDPSSGADSSEKLHELTNKQYQSNTLGTKYENQSHSGLKPSYAQRQIPLLRRNFSDFKSPVSEVSFETKFSDVLPSSDSISRVSALDRYKNTYQNYNRNIYGKKQGTLLSDSIKKLDPFPESNQNSTSVTEYRSSTSSVSLDPNKIKRKVLRHKDGKPVITEEFLDIPSIFNSSYPETLNSSKSFSSDDLSWKSNGSTGSISAVSPVALISPRSIFSLSSTHSLHSRLVNPRKKKNDPVTMYNYYKKFWNEFKPPGEKTHDKIRWAVRDKMLDYNL